ncbi:MAG: type 1 glutamine amidotransferase [Candidatus Omnitrophica bacterium]|nr:type 1 glutamine amidotransferase [Candidatus Omnitrophota bacterium]
MIIFVKNISLEGPETLGIFFQKKGYQVKEIDLDAGGRLPRDLKDVGALVVLGGPMSVYEEDKYPYLKEEDALIKRAVAQGVPYLGICLGAQLLAKACGATVGKSPQKEVGFFPIRLTPEGQKDPLFRGLEREPEIFQWHEDMFEVPSGARLLAASPACPHQAIRVGPRAYGLQFHVEITGQTVRDWSEGYFGTDAAASAKQQAMLEDYQKKKDQFHRVADKIYINFLKIIRDRSQSHPVTKSQVTW